MYRPPDSSEASSADYDIHELAGHIDHPLHPLPARCFSTNALARSAPSPAALDVNWDLYAIAHLAVHLHHDVTSSSFASSASHSGHDCMCTLYGRPVRSHSSSAACGARGASIRSRDSIASRRLAIDRPGVSPFRQAVRHPHQGCDQRVEAEVLDIIGHAADRLMREVS
jgi:hypothetical protein